MKPSASKVATAAPSSNAVKYELLSFRSTQPQQSVRFEFGHLKETFTLDLPIDANDGTTQQQNWREWKKRAIEHPTVKQYFKSTAPLHFSEFALRLPSSASGEWIGPESLRDDEEADTKLVLKLAGATTTTSSILLLYAPNIHLCTFDGIKFSACSFGHWLSASDTKTLERIRRSAGEEEICPNDWLLRDSHQSDLARLLFRVALFMHEELKLEADSYVISVPFGQYIFADGDGIGRDEVRARVQLTDVRIFWTLLLKFEEKLIDDDRAKRLEYFVHQRQAWVEARTTDYRRWAAQEAASVRIALDSPTPPPTSLFKLPKNCSWDEYGRMQLCLKMFSPLSEMVGQMGAISVKLKTVVGSIQMAAALTGSTSSSAPISINVSTRADQCLVLLPADRYMSVLTRASADPKTWGAALLDALRDAPDRLYSGLLYETSGLYQCSRDDLAKLDECLKALAPKLPGFKGIAKVVDTSALPMSVDVIRSLESKNHVDKRLFLERALEQKAFSGVVLSVLGPGTGERPAVGSSQPTVWEKKRAAATPSINAPPLRETMLIAASDREDVQMMRQQHSSSGPEDFARFEGDVAAQASSLNAGPTPAQAVAHTRMTPQGPSASMKSLKPPVNERPPPPTVFSTTEKQMPPQVIAKRAPPKVQLDEPLAPAKPPPPQVKQGPPTVFVKTDIVGSRPLQEAPPRVAYQMPSYTNGPHDAGEPLRKEQTAIRTPEQQTMDREDRGFEAMNSGSFRGNRNNFRGRGGRGGMRGGFNGNRGGRNFGSGPSDSVEPAEIVQ